MTADEVRSRSTPERNARLRMKWQVLKDATLALRGLEERAQVDARWQEAYAAYLRATRDYEMALRD